MIKFGYTSSDPLVDTFVILQPTYNSLVSNVNHTRYMEWCVPDYFSLAFLEIFACSGGFMMLLGPGTLYDSRSKC